SSMATGGSTAGSARLPSAGAAPPPVAGAARGGAGRACGAGLPRGAGAPAHAAKRRDKSKQGARAIAGLWMRRENEGPEVRAGEFRGHFQEKGEHIPCLVRRQDGVDVTAGTGELGV